MVPKKSRIPRAGFESGGYHILRSPFFSIKAKRNASESNQIAVVVGKSVDKRAVKRNFWKRQAKMHLLKVPPSGMDIIMTIYPKANALTKEHFIQEVKKSLKQLS